jgi:hypothetical protein
VRGVLFAFGILVGAVMVTVALWLWLIVMIDKITA